jgi:hypothetical protein
MHTDPPQHPLLEWMGRGQGEEFLNTGVVFNVFQAPGQTDRQEVLFLKLEKGVHLTLFEVAPDTEKFSSHVLKEVQVFPRIPGEAPFVVGHLPPALA